MKVIPISADMEDAEFTISSNSDKYSLVTEESISRRQIHLIDMIKGDTFEQVKNLYDQLIENDMDKPIHIIVGTAGGDVCSMLGIMNLLLLSKTPCYTYLLGETCSAGSWIYLCGSKRFAPKTKLVSFMLHPMSWAPSEDALGNHESHNKYVGLLSNNLIALTAERTKIPKSKLKRLSTVETQYFTGDELFTNGIATDVLDTVSFWKTDKPVKKSKKSTPQPLNE